MAGLHFEVTADNSNFRRKMQETRNEVSTLTHNIEQEGKLVDSLFTKMAASAAKLGLAFSSIDIARRVMATRGEFQQLEAAFNTMLQSKENADKLMSEMVTLAAKTPFDLKGVAAGAKQLLAYGTASENITDTLTRLGDIAAGLSIPFNDLVWLYGTTQTQGRLFTADLKQFMGRGIPLVDELAKQFGVAKDEVEKLVTEGKVGFPEVEKAIRAMTDEGGRFSGLMDMQSHTITGQIANIEDAIDMMFNKMGQSSEGVINTALDGVTWLVEHYKSVGSTILTIAAAYATWEGMLKLSSAAAKATAAVEAAEAEKITAAQEAKVAALQAEIATRERILQLAKDGEEATPEAIAKKTEEKVETPESIAAAQIAAQSEEMEKLIDLREQEVSLAGDAVDRADEAFNIANDEVVTAQRNLDYAQKKAQAANDYLEAIQETGDESEIAAAVDEAAAAAVEELVAQTALETAEENANTAAENLNAAATTRDAAASRLSATQRAADTMATSTNTASQTANTSATVRGRIAMVAHSVASKASAIATGLFTGAVNMAKNAMNALKVAIMSNPLGLIMTALTTVIGLFASASSSMDEMAEEDEKYGEKAVKTIEKINNLYAIIATTDPISKAHKQATQELVDIFKEYGITLDETSNLYQQLIDKKQRLIEITKAEGVEIQYANQITANKKEYDKSRDAIIKDMADDVRASTPTVALQFATSMYDKIANLSDDEKKELLDTYKKGLAAWKSAAGKRIVDELKAQALSIGEKELAEDITDMVNAGETKEVLDNIQGLDRANKAAKKSYDEAKKSLNGAMGAASRDIDMTNKSASELATRLQQIAADSDINIKVSFTMDEVPELLKKKYGLTDKSTTKSQRDSTLNTARKWTGYVEKYQSEYLLMNDNSYYNEADLEAILKDNVTAGSQQQRARIQEALNKVKKTGESQQLNGIKISRQLAAQFAGIYTSLAQETQKTYAATVDGITEGIAGVKSINDMKEQIKTIDDAIATADTTTQEGIDKITELRKKKTELEARIAKLDGKDSRKNKKSGTSYNATEERRKAQEGIAEFFANLQSQINEADLKVQRGITDALPEGYDKRLAEIADDMDESTIEYENKIDKFAERVRDAYKRLWMGSGSGKRTEEEWANTTQAQMSDRDLIDAVRVGAFTENTEQSEALKKYLEFVEIIYKQQRAKSAFEIKRVNDELLGNFRDYYAERAEVTRKGEEDIANLKRIALEATTDEDRKAAESAEKEASKRLTKQLSDLDIERMKTSLNWEDVFGNLARQSTPALEELRHQLELIVRTNKDISPENMKALVDAIESIRTEERGRGGVFERMKKEYDIRRRYRDEQARIDRMKSQNTKSESLNAAEKAYREATSVEAKNRAADMEVTVFDRNGTPATMTLEEYRKLCRNSVTEYEKVVTGKGKVADFLANLVPQSTLDSIATFAEQGEKMISVLGQLGFDTSTPFMEGAGKFFSGVSGLTQSMMSGDIMGTVSGVISTFEGLGQSVGSLFGLKGADYSVYDTLKSKLESINNIYDKILEDKQQLFDAVAGRELVNNAKEQLDIIERSIAGYKQLAKARLEAGASAGSHSIGVRMSKWFSSEARDQVASAGYSYLADSPYRLLEMTGEQLKELRSSAPAFWAEFDEDFRTSLDAIIDGTEKAAELTKQVQEGLTSLSFDGLRSEMSGLLADFESGSKDAIASVDKFMQNAILNSIIKGRFSKQMETWYGQFSEAMEDGDLSESEAEQLRKEYIELYERMNTEAKSAMDAAGITAGSLSGASGSKGGFATMSQDSADELNGRFAALQLYGYTIQGYTETIAAAFAKSTATGTLATDTLQREGNVILSDLRDLNAMTNSYLSDIARDIKKTQVMITDYLPSINQGLANL